MINKNIYSGNAKAIDTGSVLSLVTPPFDAPNRPKSQKDIKAHPITIEFEHNENFFKVKFDFLSNRNNNISWKKEITEDNAINIILNNILYRAPSDKIGSGLTITIGADNVGNTYLLSFSASYQGFGVLVNYTLYFIEGGVNDEFRN